MEVLNDFFRQSSFRENVMYLLDDRRGLRRRLEHNRVASQ